MRVSTAVAVFSFAVSCPNAAPALNGRGNYQEWPPSIEPTQGELSLPEVDINLIAIEKFCQNVASLQKKFNSKQISVKSFESLYRKLVCGFLSRDNPAFDSSTLKGASSDLVNFKFNNLMAEKGYAISNFSMDRANHRVDFELVKLSSPQSLSVAEYSFPKSLFGDLRLPPEISCWSSDVIFSTTPERSRLNCGIVSCPHSGFGIREPLFSVESPELTKFLRDWSLGRIAFISSHIDDSCQNPVPYEVEFEGTTVSVRSIAGLLFALHANKFNGNQNAEVAHRLIEIALSNNESEMKFLSEILTAAAKPIMSEFSDQGVDSLANFQDLVINDRMAAKVFLSNLSSYASSVLENLAEQKRKSEQPDYSWMNRFLVLAQ